MRRILVLWLNFIEKHLLMATDFLPGIHSWSFRIQGWQFLLLLRLKIWALKLVVDELFPPMGGVTVFPFLEPHPSSSFPASSFLHGRLRLERTDIPAKV